MNMNLAENNNRHAKTAAETKHAKQTFPFLLYEAIEWASNSEFSSTLTWSPSGNEFVVHDRDLALELIIPKFLDRNEFNNWKSFTNQLNLWGFKHGLDIDTSNKTKRGMGNSEGKGETYCHQYFKRGKVEELQLMQRAELNRLPTNTKEQHSYSFDTVTSDHAVSSSHYDRYGCNSSTVTGTTGSDRNHSFKIKDKTTQPQQHDIIEDKGQDTSPLTGWKLEDGSYYERSHSVLVPGGVSMIEACSDIMLGTDQTTTPHTHISSEAPMQNQNEMQPHVLQHKLLMQSKMMMQHHRFHGYPLAPGDVSWKFTNQPKKQETLNKKVSPQQLVVIAKASNNSDCEHDKLQHSKTPSNRNLAEK